MPGKRSRLILPVIDLNFTGVWEVGTVRFHPAGTASTLVRATRGSAPVAVPAWYEEIVDERAAELDHSAVAEVMAVDLDEAMRRVTDALGVLRVVLRLQYPLTVDVREQTFGLAGQVTRAKLDYLDITSVPTEAWRRVGAATGWTFRDVDHDAWLSKPAFRFLDEALRRSDDARTSLQRRALIAIDLFNQAWLSWQPDVALLASAMALEVLLGEPNDKAKKFRVARRVSYFTCGWPDDRHLDGRPACPYLTLPIDKKGNADAALLQLIKDVEAGPAPDKYYCSRFLDVLDLFDARNEIAHRGRLGLTLREEERVTWCLSGWLLEPVLTWFAEHPDNEPTKVERELTELDAEIVTLPIEDVTEEP